LFEKFITDYNKNYQDEAEKAHRFLVFRLNLKKIEFLNMKERGSAKYGVTQFADLSSEEFSKRHGLQNHLADQQEISERRITVADDVQLPKSFDWREKGAVAEVKDQGFCGSCWAFSVTGNIEGQVALKNKTLISLSEQELVDCDTRDNGCGGGFMTLAYKSVIESKSNASCYKIPM
jgi:cathepsin F